MQLKQWPQFFLCEALELGWTFKVVLIVANAPTHLCISYQPIIGHWLSLREGIILGEVVSCSQGQFPLNRIVDLSVANSPSSWGMSTSFLKRRSQKSATASTTGHSDPLASSGNFASSENSFSVVLVSLVSYENKEVLMG